MRTTKHHWIRNTALSALFLLGCLALANLYLNNRIASGPGSSGVGQRIAESPVLSFLSRWFLREAVPISRDRNARVLKNVLEVFDPSLRSFLASVPIVLDSSANTAKAYPAKGYIGVSPDWDRTVLRSEYRAIYEQRGMKPEDPVFMDSFKTNLLIHEFLHILQVHQRISSDSCYETVARWYRDPRYGLPSPDGIARDGRSDTLAINRMKYILWDQLHDHPGSSAVPRDESWEDMQYGQRYHSAQKGVEEFAYIGEEILASGSTSGSYLRTGRWSDADWKSKKMRLREVSPEVIALFKGVFDPRLTN